VEIIQINHFGTQTLKALLARGTDTGRSAVDADKIARSRITLGAKLGRQDNLIPTPGKSLAQELLKAVRNNVTIDWTIRENVRAQLRVIVKRILRQHGYPPDKQEKATQTVLEQAELLSGEWAT
jgi:type I restriction enzyme R subunit